MLSTVAPGFDQASNKRSFRPWTQRQKKLLKHFSRENVSAFMSWLRATGASLIATGMVCFKIPERTTISTRPSAISDDELPSSPSSVMHSSAPLMRSDFMSLGDTQGISPFQNSSLSRLGVPPPTKCVKCLSLEICQCPGTFPNHSTPESLYCG